MTSSVQQHGRMVAIVVWLFGITSGPRTYICCFSDNSLKAVIYRPRFNQIGGFMHWDGPRFMIQQDHILLVSIYIFCNSGALMTALDDQNYWRWIQLKTFGTNSIAGFSTDNKNHPLADLCIALYDKKSTTFQMP